VPPLSAYDLRASYPYVSPSRLSWAVKRVTSWAPATGRGRAPLRKAPSRAGRPSLRNFGGSELARTCIVCNSEPMGNPLLSDDGLVMFASLVLAGHAARWVRKLLRGSPISPNVLHYLRLLPL
jgi:hypothetical protein